MALILGYCTNTMPLALAVGLALELFWIDLLRLGIVIPASATFSFLLLYPLCLIFQWQLPSALPIPFCICLFFGHAASLLEHWQRAKNTYYDTQLELWVENTCSMEKCSAENQNTDTLQHKGMSPAHIISRSTWRMLWSSSFLYFTSFALLYSFFSWLEKIYFLPVFSEFNWQILYSISLVGAILALRTRRAYKFLGAYLICLFIMALF